jgi:hypothetical protein
MLSPVDRQAAKIARVAYAKQQARLEKQFLKATEQVSHELGFVAKAFGKAEMPAAARDQFSFRQRIEKAIDVRDAYVKRQQATMSVPDKLLSETMSHLPSNAEWAQRVETMGTRMARQPEGQVRAAIDHVVDREFARGRASLPDAAAEVASGEKLVQGMTGLAKITAIWDNREQLIDNFLKTGKFKVDDLVWARREDGPAMDRVKGIMQKLQTAAPEAPYPVRPALYQKQDANAFALGGGQIGVHEGMLKSVDNDDQLAFILAHELAHDLHRDHPGGHAIQKAQNELLDALRAGKAPKELVSEVDSGFKDATLRRARRKMEEQADLDGARFAARAGYDPREGASYIGRITEPKATAEDYAKHGYPAPWEREKAIRDLIDRERLVP